MRAPFALGLKTCPNFVENLTKFVYNNCEITTRILKPNVGIEYLGFT